MANKIKAIMENHLRWYSEGKATIKELRDNYETLLDLVYKNWREELISDKVKNECYGVLTKYQSELFKLTIRENQAAV